MSKIRVGVVRGGPSKEYDVSLKTGAAVLSILRNELNDKYDAIDVLIDREGIWHVRGVSIDPEILGDYVDVVWNALHGEYGEDGMLDSVLESVRIPSTTRFQFLGDVVSNKQKTKELARQLGLETPHHEIVRKDLATIDSEYVISEARKIFAKIPPPWVIKPLIGGSSIHLRLARTFDELVLALYDGLSLYDDLLVEEYVRGREIVAGVVPKFRNKNHYQLLPLEIHKNEGVLSHDVRQTGSFRFLDTHALHPFEKEEIRNIVHSIAEMLDHTHPFTVDLIVTPKKIVVLEVDGVPALGEHTPLFAMLEKVGCTPKQFVEHILAPHTT
jgi:D-alanine-D-alanine ligase